MKAVIYAAKSTLDEHDSIPDQIAECRELAKDQGWDIDDANVFKDEAFSAYSGNRGPDLEKALCRAEELAPCVLVAQNADRIARGDGITAQHFGEVFFRMLKSGVRIWTADDGREIVDASGAASEGDRSHKDSKRKSRSVAGGIRRRREDRHRFHGQTPLGYGRAMRIVKDKDGKDKEDRYLVVDDAGAAVVERIFREFIAGRPQRRIAQDLNAQGIEGARGNRFSATTVRDILKNPVFLGRMRVGDEIIDADHPAIIDQATFDRAQALFSARPAAERGAKARPRERYLLIGGMLRCGECGEAMTPKTQRSKAGTRDTYGCRGRQQFGDCSQGPVARATIDEAVLRHFERALHDFDATVDAIAKQAMRYLDEARQLRTQAERAAAKATESVERVKADYTEGRIDAAEWRELRGDLMERKTAADAELERLREQESALDSATSPDARRETIKHLAELRQVVAGEVLATDKIETVRAALQRIYSRFELNRGPLPDGLTVDDADALEAGDLYITMDVRDDAPIEYDMFTGGLRGRESIAPTLSQSLVQLKPVRAAISS